MALERVPSVVKLCESPINLTLIIEWMTMGLGVTTLMNILKSAAFNI